MHGNNPPLVEQMTDLALKMADDGYIMSPGRMAMEGFPKEIAEHGTLEKKYLGGSNNTNPSPPLGERDGVRGNPVVSVELRVSRFYLKTGNLLSGICENLRPKFL
jgi:hypothetical protein